MNKTAFKPFSAHKEINWIITDDLETVKQWSGVLPLEQTYDFGLIFSYEPESFECMEDERIWRSGKLADRLRVRSATHDAMVLVITQEERAALEAWFARPKEQGTLSELREAHDKSALATLMRERKIPREALFGFTNSCCMFGDELIPLRLSNSDTWLRLLDAKAHKFGYAWRLK